MSFWEKKFFSKFFEFFVNPIRVPPVKTQKSTSFLRKTNMTATCAQRFSIDCISWYDIRVKIADLYKVVVTHIYINLREYYNCSRSKLSWYTSVYPAVISLLKVQKFFFSIRQLIYIINHKKWVFEKKKFFQNFLVNPVLRWNQIPLSQNFFFQ